MYVREQRLRKVELQSGDKLHAQFDLHARLRELQQGCDEESRSQIQDHAENRPLRRTV